MEYQTPLRVAAYARVSTEKEDQMHSLESQRSYFAQYINAKQNMQLTKIYYDEGISGTQIRNRIGFQQMIEDALQGRFNLILTKEVSRFARNTVDTLAYTRKLKEAGVGIIFTIDHIDTRDQDGELRLTIMASLAQEESRKTSERVKWGQKRRMEQGVVFGRDMLGYTVKNGILSIQEEEALIVKAIFHKYTNEGKGAFAIARELHEEGIFPKRMEEWSGTVILRILHNEKYVGDLCQKKTFTPDYLTHKKKYNRGQEEKIYIKNHHEGIIARELWNRTQEELARRSSLYRSKERHSNRYWCSGKIRCGECGSRFISRTRKLQSGTYRAWWCFQKSRHGGAKILEGQQIGCSNRSINERALFSCMKYCNDLLCDQKDKERIREEILENIRKVRYTSELLIDMDKITQKIGAIEAKKRKAFDMMLDDKLSKDDSYRQIQWYDKEITHLQELISQSRQKQELYRIDQEKTDLLEKALDEILSFGDGDQNEMLYREILQEIVVYREEERGCNRLVVWLKSLPFGIQLKIHSTGNGANFRTEILETEFVDRNREGNYSQIY